MQIDIVVLMLTAFGTALAVIGSNIALISWIRSDMKSFESEMKADRKYFETEIRTWRDEIKKEMKDFHGRLCTIEERKK